MSDLAIRVENLCKLYRIGQQERYLALRDVLARSLTAPFRWFRNSKSPDSAFRLPVGRHGNPHSEFIWALKDVSFEVHHGEVVGIIGRNGERAKARKAERKGKSGKGKKSFLPSLPYPMIPSSGLRRRHPPGAGDPVGGREPALSLSKGAVGQAPRCVKM